MLSVFIRNGINIVERNIHNCNSFCNEDYVLVTEEVHVPDWNQLMKTPCSKNMHSYTHNHIKTY